MAIEHISWVAEARENITLGSHYRTFAAISFLAFFSAIPLIFISGIMFCTDEFDRKITPLLFVSASIAAALSIASMVLLSTGELMHNDLTQLIHIFMAVAVILMIKIPMINAIILSRRSKPDQVTTEPKTEVKKPEAKTEAPAKEEAPAAAAEAPKAKAPAKPKAEAKPKTPKK